ncbi:MAG: xanthine dehydrogenase family protein subunit M [Pseudomonadota bacterium]|nr:xanthine dehydrogenase family protein subunit M [Pseudomonadota bacterium]
MKASDFIYHRPGSVDEAIALLGDYGGSARILAGGQSLMPMMNLRLWRPSALIDIGRVSGLDQIEERGDVTILGALVRYHTIEHDPLIARRLPLLAHMIRYVGDRQVRNRGSIGGSLVQADPTGEMPLAALTLGAVALVRGPNGERQIPLEEFFLGSYATALENEEMLLEVHYPRHPDHFIFAEVNRRHNDFAVVSVAVLGDCSDGIWRNLRIGLGGVDETPVLARAAMDLVEGTALDCADIAKAATSAAAEISPPSDIRASDEYRRHLTEIHVGRALRALADCTTENKEALL